MKIDMTVDAYVALRGVPQDMILPKSEFKSEMGRLVRELHVARHGSPSSIVVPHPDKPGEIMKAYDEANHDLLDMAYDILSRLSDAFSDVEE